MNKDSWKELKEETQIYELQLPNFAQMKRLIGKRLNWSSGNPKREERWSYRRTKDKALVLEVIGVWSNPKDTVKVIKAGDREHIALFSRNERPEGWTSLSYDRYSDHSSDLFENIKIGSFLITGQRYSGEDETELEVYFISNEKNLKDVKGILEILSKMSKTKAQYPNYRWKDEGRVKTYGTVNLSEVLLQEGIFRRRLRFFRWKERKEKWDLANQMKARATMSKKNDRLKVRVKALDGNIYRLDTPLLPKEEENLGWRSKSVFSLEYWRDFCYREPNDSFLRRTPKEQTESLVSYFLEIISKLSRSPEIKLGFNRRSVTITRKKTDKGSSLVYLDGKIVKADSVSKKLEDYFIRGTPITSLKRGKKAQKQVMSKEAEKLIEKGLNGKLRDLEGELPFHLNVIYKPKLRKWYLEIAGKEFYIRGGYNNLKKVKTAIEGTGIVQNRRKLGYDSRGTKVIRHRLGELVGDKNALWIILHVKKMGALYKAMQGEDE